MGETLMTLFPDEGFKITCTSADKDGRFTQFFSTEVTPKTWEKELAHARTFCFYEEIEYLIKNGLIKGGSLENAVVIRDDAVLTTEPLRYPEEFVRHKMLDIVGDLSLLGRPLHGHLIAVKPSHAGNCELARQIVAQMQQAVARGADLCPAAAAQAGAASLPVREACRRTARHGHRGSDEDVAAPLSVPDGGPDREDRGQPDRGREERDHERAVFPGAFSRASHHAGRAATRSHGAGGGHSDVEDASNAGNQVAYFMAAENVKWRKPVLPGDVLVIEVELTKIARQDRQGQGRLQSERRNRERSRSHLHVARD